MRVGLTVDALGKTLEAFQQTGFGLDEACFHLVEVFVPDEPIHGVDFERLKVFLSLCRHFLNAANK